MHRLLVRSHGPAAREALWTAIDAAKAGEPLAPVTVAAPSPYAGLALRRALARRGGGSGFVNVRFLPLARVAELLGAPQLVGGGRRPLTSALRSEAVRATLADHASELGAPALHPATERSVDATLHELRRAGRDAIRVLERRGGRPTLIVRLFEGVRARTSAFYDEEDLAEAAAGAVTDGAAATDDLGEVVLHLPTQLSPGETALVDALAERGRLRAVLGLTGDDQADEPVRGLAAHLARVLHSPADALEAGSARPPLGTAVVSAPDPEDEVREALRHVVARARSGTPFHRIAVLYRTPDPYVRIARQSFDDAGIPWTGPSDRRLAGSVAGRVLLGLLHLVDTGFRRDATVEWMAAGPIIDPADGTRIPATRWDTLSREAGIVGGIDQWETRLARLAAERGTELTAIGADPDAPAGARSRLVTDIAHIERLGAFVAGLGTALVAPAPPTWPALVAWAQRLVDRYLGGEGRRRDWPDDELDAARRVGAIVESLSVLAEIRPTVELSVFVRALEAELAAPTGRAGRFGDGVFLGSVRAAGGTDFDVVHVLGMAEGAFPPRGEEDPLLPDRDREATGGDLALHSERRADERREYLGALACAPERVLFLPRADPRAQRKRLPARWLLETASVCAGFALGADALERQPVSDWYRLVESFEAGMLRGGEAGSLTEYDVRSLREWRGAGRPLERHPLVAATRPLAAGVTATSARRSARATSFDGIVGPIPGLLPVDGRPVSPTALEDWATCPFRYLLARVLHVREVERPEETETISPLERGSLVHAVLEEFLRTATPRTSPRHGWSADERAHLLAIAERHSDAAEAQGLTGRRVLWHLERRRILRALAGALAVDEKVRADLGVVPREQEVAFGLGQREPLELSLDDGGAVTFRGRIDRIDVSPDGSRVVVFDYKTGSGRGYDEPLEELASGTRLQLPVYGLATHREHPGADVHSYYWFVERAAEDALYGYHLDEARPVFEDVLHTILDGVGEGVFPAYPGEPRQDGRGRDTWTNCCYCPYDRVCPPARDDMWDRKADDPVVAVFRDLAEPEEPA